MIYITEVWLPRVLFQSFYDVCILSRAMLTNCCLMTQYCDINLCQQWFRQWLANWRHQAITSPNVDFPLVSLCGIYRRTISKRVIQLPLCIIYLKSHVLKPLLHLPGASKLKIMQYVWRYWLLYPPIGSSWWRHQMEKLSALLAICAGNSPIIGEFLS